MTRHVPSRRTPRGGGKTDSHGLTLLEVMVAMAILAVSMTSLMSSQLASIRATRYAQQVTTIAFLAEFQLIEVEYTMRKEGGWILQDKIYENNFAAQGWPDVRYKCIVDFLEIPDYSKLRAAKDETDQSKQGESSVYYKNAGDKAFNALGMVWPMIKQAIERSIRKVKCTVFWKDGKDSKLQYEYSIYTFWADPEKLKTLPGLGGEAKEGDEADVPGGGAGGAGGKDSSATGAGGGATGALRPAGGGGGLRPAGGQK